MVFRFLREELSSTQLDLIKSRSEVKVLLEELSACKTDNLEAGQFPNLLLSTVMIVMTVMMMTFPLMT